MTRILKKRLFFLLSAAAFSGALFAVGGFLLARALTVASAETKLDNYASRIVADVEAYRSELRTVLAAVNASTLTPCSSTELDAFSRLIFESDFVKDAGRMHDGTILCSAQKGVLPTRKTEYEPNFTQQDGTEIYKNLPLYNNGEIVLQSGDAFVVFTPLTRMHLEPAPMHYQETAIDAPTQKPGVLLGESSEIDPTILRNEGTAREGDHLYATRCSIRFFNCVTAFTTVSAMAATEWTQFTACVVICGVLGAFFGLVGSFMYGRNKSLEQQLRRAIAKDKLRMVYQPIVDIKTGRIVGAETLARWTNEEGAAVAPDLFVRIAEEHGFVGEITRLVLRHAVRDLGATLRTDAEFRLSVNVTASDLSNPGFLPMLRETLEQAAVPANKLNIEVTESSTARQDMAKETISQLREMGHNVHIDDFGTGYSSLAYLHDLAASAIKIDKAFTQAIGTGSIIVSILPQILAMADALNLGVIVEGIETREQADYFAAQEHTVYGQGWLFGRPVPILEFRAKLAEDRSRGPVIVPGPRVVAMADRLTVA